MAKKKKAEKKIVKTYEGIDRVLRGEASVFRTPYLDGDRFEYDNLSVITAAVRNGEALYAVGQRLEGPGGVFEVEEIQIWTNQHNLCQSEAELEGFAHPAVFAALYAARYGDAVYRPAWRVKVAPIAAQAMPELGSSSGEELHGRECEGAELAEVD